jgi:hypothetical protein
MRKLLLLVAFLALPGGAFIFPVAYAHPGAYSHIHLCVMTYNIHVGVGMDKKLDLQRIADVINREHS